MRFLVCVSTLLLIAALNTACRQTEAEKQLQTEKDIQKVEMKMMENGGTGSEKKSCACIPHNCCCGPFGQPCKWCGSNPKAPACQ